MKALTTVAIYALVPVPPMQNAQGLVDRGDQPPLVTHRQMPISSTIDLARSTRP